jgi:hypothetical protein
MQEKKYFKNNVEIHELKKNIEKLIKQPNKEFFEQQVNLYLEKDSTEFFRFLLCQLTRIQLRSGMGNLLFLVNLTAYTSDGSFITVTNPLLDPLQHKNFVDLPSGQFSDVEKIFLSSGLVVGFFDQKIQPELNYYLTILLTLDPKFDSVKLSESLIKNIEKYVENSGLSSVIASYNKFSLLLQAIKPEQKIEFNIASYIMLRNIVEKGIYELTSYEKEWLNDFFALLGQENCGYILLAYINHSFNKEIPVFSHGQFNEAVSTAARIINYVPNAYCLEQAISHADVPELCIIAIGLKDKFDENVELIKQALARLKTIDESLYRELGNSALFSEAQKQVLFPELQRVVVQVEQPLREQLVPLQEQELGHRQIQASAIEELKLSLKKWINSRAIQVLLVTAGLGTLAYFLRKSNRVPIPLWLRWQKH